MDPKSFRQWSPPTRIGGRAIPGLLSKAAPKPIPKKAYGRPMGQAAVAGTGTQMALPHVAAQTTAAGAKRGTQLKLPGGALMHTPSKELPTPKPTIGQAEAAAAPKPSPPTSSQYKEPHPFAQQRAEGRAADAAIDKPLKTGPVATHADQQEHESWVKQNQAPVGGGGKGGAVGGGGKGGEEGAWGSEKRPKAAGSGPSVLGPNILGSYGFGYAVGQQAGQVSGPATTVAMATHRLAGAAHGLLAPPTPHEHARMQREAFGQRAEQIRRAPAPSQSSMKSLDSTPPVRSGVRRIG